MENAPALTDLTAVNGYYRLLNDVRARVRAIQFQADVQDGFNAKAVAAVNELNRCEGILLDIKYTTTESWKVRTVRNVFRRFGSVKVHMLELFGDYKQPNSNRPIDSGEKKLLDALRVANREARVRSQKARIQLELMQRDYEGWYLIFNTLTVAPEHYNSVFYGGDSRAFEKYIMKMKYRVGLACYGKAKIEKGAEYHSHFSVVERGGKTGRLHFHCLHFCRKLPKECTDPNVGRVVPDRRIIEELRDCWPYGYSSPIAVRFSGMDNYAKLGWRWPVSRKNGKPVAIASSTGAALATYVSNYVKKAQYEDSWKWKTRMSQGFGIGLVRKAMPKMTNESLEHLMTLSSWMHVTIGDLTLPVIEVRKEATRQFLVRLNNGSWSLKKLPIQKFIQNLGPRPSIVSQYRTLISRKPSPSLRSTTCSLTKTSNATAIFDSRCVFEEVLCEYGFDVREIEGRGKTV